MSSNPTLATAAFKLSSQQERAWLQHEAGVRGFAQCVIAITGTVDVTKLQQTLQQLVSEYEILRTVFRRQTGIKLPFQVIQEESRVLFADLRSGDTADLARRDRESAWNLENGPTLRATLAGSKLILTLPALCADSSTLKNLFGEFVARYQGGNAASDGPMQYADLVEWQNEMLASDETKPGREFWRELCRSIDFAALQSIVLPLQMPGSSFSPDVVARTTQSEPLASLASRAKLPVEDVLLTAWNVLLFRLTGHPDLTVGAEFNGRRYEELEAAFGPLARVLPLKSEVQGETSLEVLARRVASNVTEARNWQESFSWSQAAGEEHVLPFTFSYHDLGTAELSEGVSFTLERIHVVSEPYRLRLAAIRRGSELELEFHYDASRFEPSAIERIAGYYTTLLSAALANPATAVSRLPLLSDVERKQVVADWNQTAAEYPRTQCLHQLFEAQAAKTPERIAVRSGEQAFSYRELNERANQLAHHLRKQGVGPDCPVGLCLDRSAETMVAVLAILKAGGAYVPLNADNPPARLKQQLEGAAALITESKYASQMPQFSGPVIVLDRDQKQWATEPKSNPAVNTNPENLVYVIYTSGSTGVPKGVAVRHRNLVNYAHFITKRLDLEKYPEGLQFATVSTLGADLGNTCIYPSLISGGTLHIIGYEMATDPRRFSDYTAKHPIDVLKIVPSHLAALLQSDEAQKLLPRKYLITGGETLTPKLIEKIASLNPACEVINHYGPTETTVGSLTLKLKEYDWKTAGLTSIPIGRPIANTQVYVLDQNLEPVPVGVIGELYIAGDGVTAGYLGQPEKTAERFLKNPFSSDTNAKMYRTGDLARYGEDGNIEFLGRGDDQVKVRGFRIELGEIESVLAKHSAVKQVVVLAREDERGDKRLLAYVVPSREAAEVKGEELRSYLRQQLPDYMVPQAVVILAKLPLTANGKIDRKALPEPEQAKTQREIVLPRNEEEAILLRIWRSVLRRDRISIDDNFFELGGHSLMAVQLMAEIKKETSKEIPLAALFQGATIEHLANLLRGATEVDKSILRPIQENGSLPPFFAAVLPGVNALGYLTLSKHMGGDQPVYMLQSPGPGPRVARRPYTPQEYEKVASDYIRAMRSVQPTGPYYLGGMCEGARIAFEMARLLEAEGQEVNLLAVIDTWVVENTQNQKLWKLYYYSVRLRQLWRQPWRAKIAMAKTAARNRMHWWFRSESAPPKSEWVHTYWPGEDFVPSRIHGKIVIFKAPKQPFYYHKDELMGWGSRTETGVEIETIPDGRHRLMLREPHVRQLAAALSKVLSRLHPDTSEPALTDTHERESADAATVWR
jgi:amino acid adenylation domain-containing protein